MSSAQLRLTLWGISNNLIIHRLSLETAPWRGREGVTCSSDPESSANGSFNSTQATQVKVQGTGEKLVPQVGGWAIELSDRNTTRQPLRQRANRQGWQGPYLCPKWCLRAWGGFRFGQLQGELKGIFMCSLLNSKFCVSLETSLPAGENRKLDTLQCCCFYRCPRMLNLGEGGMAF